MTRRSLGATAAGLAASGASAWAQDRPRLLLLSGAPGGAFHEYGPILARIVAKTASLDLDVRASAGSNENIRALESGEADLGLVNMGPAFDAWEGRPPARSGPSRALRALFPMYDTPFTLVALRERGIADLSGLAGRTVGVGPAGGPAEGFFKGLAKALDLVVGRTVTGSPSDLARQVIAGEIDAFWFGAGVPVTAFVEVLESADAVVLGLSEQELAAFRRTYAYVAPTSIPAGTYKGQTEPLPTGSVWNFVVGSEGLSEDAAYGLTRAALDHGAAMAAELPAAAGTTAGNVVSDTFMPLHPGAARFYRERGVALPLAIAPP